jgi:cytidylate kinase
MTQGQVERQAELIDRWLASEGLEKAIAESGDPGWRMKETGPYIALSRESGAGGGHIGRLVAERLGWDLLDKELLDLMADRYKLPRDMLDVVDETRANWVHEWLGNWFDRKAVNQMEFVAHTVKLVLLSALHGRVVFVGRGAQFVLPRPCGLAVRIIGPRKTRIHRTSERLGLSWAEAEKFVDKTDNDRRKFVKRYFHHDVDELPIYDIVLNVEKLGQEGAASQIVAAWETAFRRSSVKAPISSVRHLVIWR